MHSNMDVFKLEQIEELESSSVDFEYFSELFKDKGCKELLSLYVSNWRHRSIQQYTDSIWAQYTTKLVWSIVDQFGIFDNLMSAVDDQNFNRICVYSLVHIVNEHLSQNL